MVVGDAWAVILKKRQFDDINIIRKQTGTNVLNSPFVHIITPKDIGYIYLYNLFIMPS